MSFLMYRGRFKRKPYPKAASTAVTDKSVMQLDGSGQLIVATNTSTVHCGVIDGAVVSTDSDYANTSPRNVLVGDSEAEWLADVTGTLATTNVGDHLDLSTALLVDAATTADNTVYCTGYKSATQGMFQLVSRASTQLPNA